jgi:hypothetical protein
MRLHHRGHDLVVDGQRHEHARPLDPAPASAGCPARARVRGRCRIAYSDPAPPSSSR